MKRIDPKSVIIGLLSGVCIMLLMGQAKEEKPKKSGVHDSIVTKALYIANDKGDMVGALAGTSEGDGYFSILDSKGKHVVSAMSLSTKDGPSYGTITVCYDGKERVILDGADHNNHGGSIGVKNKTGERVVELHADEYGNGVVGAFNRKGKGRTLQPGP